jgi:phosphatidylglycerophosphate synthase
MNAVSPAAAIPGTGRPREIEPWSNRLVVHRLSAALLPLAVRAGIHPNAVTASGLLFGLMAALAYRHWQQPAWAGAGFLLMICWHVMDGLDGALARATGRSTPLGRLLDGVADYATFVAVNLMLVATMRDWQLALGLAILSGMAHILQSLFYEAGRETYVRRLAGRYTATPRTSAGGIFERAYNAGEAWLGNRTRAFDRALAAAPPDRRAELLRRWQNRAAPAMMWLSLLSANGRTIAIWLACLAGSPFYYWIWETVGLTLIGIAGAMWLRRTERVAAAG